MLRVIVIDDEFDSIQLICGILNEIFPDIEIIEACQNPKDAIKAINKSKPDLIITDIEMPGINGFELIELIHDKTFDIIFITAYDQYAIKAFKYSAIDYLLKPIDIEEFENAIKKVLNKQTKEKTVNKKLQVLTDYVKSQQPTKLALPNKKGIEFININDIIRLKADGRYTEVHLSNNKQIVVTKLLSELIDIIDSETFFRTHKSHYINMEYVKMFVTKDGNYIEMKDGSQVAIARNKKDEFIQQMKSYTE